jgi:hypothetical protein
MSQEHQPTDFTEREYDYTAAVTVDGPTADGDLTVTTTCPACAGRTRTEFTTGMPQGTKGPALSTATGKVTVICACGYPHNLRPGDSAEYGCGAYWKVALP